MIRTRLIMSLEGLGFAVLSAMILLMTYNAVLFAINTPFALVDDYTDWFSLKNLSQWDSFKRWLSSNFWVTADSRWRPHFDIINSLTWSIFGENYSLHHVFRYGVRLTSSIFFSASFWTFVKQLKDISLSTKLTLTLVVFCICQFYPICPDARLAPVELWSSFYLSLCFYAITQHCVIDRRKFFWELLFLVSASLCLIVKEVNFILVSCLALASRTFFKFSIVSLLSLIVLTGLSIFKVTQAAELGGYGKAPLSLALVELNLRSLISYMFTWSIVAGLWLPSLIALLGIIQSPIKNIRSAKDFMEGPASSRLLITVLLCFVLFSGLSLTFWSPVLRYYFPLVGPLALLIGLGLMELFKAMRSVVLKEGFSIVCLFWIIVFLYGNMSNYLYQFATQSVTRKVEYELLIDAEKEISNGLNLAITLADEHEAKFVVYFEMFRAFYGRSSVKVFQSEDLGRIPGQSVYYSRKLVSDPGLIYEGEIHSQSAMIFRERYFHILESLHLSPKGQRQQPHSTWNDAGGPNLSPVWHKYRKI